MRYRGLGLVGVSSNGTYQEDAGVDTRRLDLRAKLYQESIWPEVQSVANGHRIAAPVVVDLDPTTFCDLACPECISSSVLNQGRFTPTRLADLTRELVVAGVRAVILIGGGEPLAHTGTDEALRLLGEAGIHVGVVTNGTLIDRHIEHLARFASWVRVSVDAGSSATYGRFRPNRRGQSLFDGVVTNMRSLAARKDGALGYSYLLMSRTDAAGDVVDSNFTEVAAAARLARAIGCDYFELKAMFDPEHYVVAQPAHLLRALEDQIEQILRLEAGGFRVIFSSTLQAMRTSRPAVQEKHYSRCKVAELRTLVTPLGVFICPYHRGNAAAKLGDAVHQSFDDIWRTAPTDRIDPSRDCGFHCARHDSNLELDAIGRGLMSRTLVEDFDLFL